MSVSPGSEKWLSESVWCNLRAPASSKTHRTEHDALIHLLISRCLCTNTHFYYSEDSCAVIYYSMSALDYGDTVYMQPHAVPQHTELFSHSPLNPISKGQIVLLNQ